MSVSGDQTQRFVIHDRDTIYSEGVDRTLAAMGLTVLKTPVRVPQGDAFCERVRGSGFFSQSQGEFCGTIRPIGQEGVP